MAKSKNDFASIGNLYGSMLNGVKHQLVAEGKLGPAVATNKSNPTVTKGEIGDSKLAPDRGPRSTAGYMPAKVDKKTISSKDLEDNLYNINDLSYDEDEESKKPKKGMFTKVKKAAEKDGYSKKAAEKIAGAAKAKKRGVYKENDEEITEESRKIAKERLNNFMKRKSIFDKLYENVMQPGGAQGAGQDGGMDDSQELDALGIEDEHGGEEEGDVTFTLDRATAEKLLDVIGAAMGQEHYEGPSEDEYGGEEDSKMYGGEEDEEGFWDEDEEEFGGAKDLSKEVNYGKNNKVSNLKVQGQAVSSGYVDKTGVSDEYGHTLVNAKQPNMGKDNKVKSVLKSAGGKRLFEV